MSRAVAALEVAERAERPELPLPGFRLVRRPGEEWPVVLDTSGRVIHRPMGRVQRASADGTHLALEVAPDGTELAHLDLVDTRGASRRVDAVRLRHGDHAWGGRVLHVVDASGQCLSVDPSATEPVVRVVRRAFGDRPRPLSLGNRVVLALPSTSTGGTDVIDLDGRRLLGLPRVRALRSAGGTALAVSETGLHLLRADGSDVVETARLARDATTDGTLVHAAATGTGCALHVLRDGHSRIVIHDAHLRPLDDWTVSDDDDVVTVSGLAWSEGRLWARLEGPARPPRVVDLHAPSEPGPGTAPSRLVTVTADDGVDLDVVVTGDARGPAPVLLEVYGGFGVVDVPAYEPSVAAWCALGGVHVTARVRGGGGSGSAWHEAARGAHKARAVADTVSVAKALAARGVTRPELLVVAGASHGGLVAASAALAEPGLVSAACVTAAPLDPHRLLDNPLGAVWTAEFGDPSDPAVRASMDDYSPLARAHRWPADSPLPRFLLTTFAEDTRVEPGATDRLADALRRRGAEVTRHHRPSMGHGRNSHNAVHDFSASVLDFALAPTGDR